MTTHNQPFVFEIRELCPGCGASGHDILISLPFTDNRIASFLRGYYSNRLEVTQLDNGKYELARCLHCNFVWQRHILDSRGMASLYEVWIDPEASLHKRTASTTNLYLSYAREAYIISKLVNKRPGEISVLDFGMGWGFWATMAQAFSYNVLGQEISDKRLDFARSRGIKTITDLKEIPDDSLDYVHTEQVIEHLPDPAGTLEDMARVVRPKGYLYIAVPDRTQALKALAQGTWTPSKDSVQPLEHINCFNHKSLINFAALHGFRLIQQPYLLVGRKNMLDLFRAVMGRFKQQFLGTSLYFQKID